jgi:hypothetical protein
MRFPVHVSHQSFASTREGPVLHAAATPPVARNGAVPWLGQSTHDWRSQFPGWRSLVRPCPLTDLNNLTTRV